MGFRMRKSFKVAPGLRVNVSKRGAGVSVAVKPDASASTPLSQNRLRRKPRHGPGYVKQYGEGNDAPAPAPHPPNPHPEPPHQSSPRTRLFAPRRQGPPQCSLSADTQGSSPRNPASSHRAVAHAIAGPPGFLRPG